MWSAQLKVSAYHGCERVQHPYGDSVRECSVCMLTQGITIVIGRFFGCETLNVKVHKGSKSESTTDALRILYCRWKQPHTHELTNRVGVAMAVTQLQGYTMVSIGMDHVKLLWWMLVWNWGQTLSCSCPEPMTSPRSTKAIGTHTAHHSSAACDGREDFGGFPACRMHRSVGISNILGIAKSLLVHSST